MHRFRKPHIGLHEDQVQSILLAPSLFFIWKTLVFIERCVGEWCVGEWQNVLSRAGHCHVGATT